MDAYSFAKLHGVVLSSTNWFAARYLTPLNRSNPTMVRSFTTTHYPWSKSLASNTMTSNRNATSGSVAPRNASLTAKREMEIRHSKGLCYWCDEQYVSGHKCKSSIFLIEVEEEGRRGSRIGEGETTQRKHGNINTRHSRNIGMLHYEGGRHS